MRQIMLIKKCDPIILTPNGSIWKLGCIYKICEHSNETKTVKEIFLEKYKKLTDYVKSDPRKVYRLEIINPKLSVRVEVFFDVPQT